MKKELIKFLKSKRAYSKFVRNLKNVRSPALDMDGNPHGDIKSLMDYFDSKEHPLLFIKNTPIAWAFTWDATPEGGHFWDKLNEEFFEHYRKLNEVATV